MGKFNPNITLPKFLGVTDGGDDGNVRLIHRDYLGKAAGYKRVSGPGQEIDGTSLETQDEELVQWAEADRYYMPEEWIFEDVISGVSTVRPGFTRLEQLLETESINVVVVHDPDRLGREPAVMFHLVDRILNRGVAIKFLHGPAAPDTPEGRLVMYIMAYAAHRERMQIADKDHEGQESGREIRQDADRWGRCRNVRVRLLRGDEDANNQRS